MIVQTAAIAIDRVVAAVAPVVAGDVTPQGPDPTDVSPGLVGFLATFGLVVAAIALFFSMTRHLRKVDYAKRQQSQNRVGSERGQQDERAQESSLEEPGPEDRGAGEPGAQERDEPPGRS